MYRNIFVMYHAYGEGGHFIGFAHVDFDNKHSKSIESPLHGLTGKYF